jgi:hypothetical protein
MARAASVTVRSVNDFAISISTKCRIRHRTQVMQIWASLEGWGHVRGCSQIIRFGVVPSDCLNNEDCRA